MEVNEVAASPPSLAQLYAMFHPIQESAFSCNLPDASSHLCGAEHHKTRLITQSWISLSCVIPPLGSISICFRIK